MPTINSYATLVQAIQDWSHRGSALAPYVDYFIQSAQEAIENDIPDQNWGNGIAWQEAPYGPYTLLNGSAPVPADYLSPKVFTIGDGLGDYSTLIFKTPAWIYDIYAARVSTGIPAYIARASGSALAVDEFTAAEGQTIFQLSASPTTIPLVTLGGAILYPTTDYSISGDVITLVQGAAEGATLTVSYVGFTGTQAFTATGGQTVFTVSGTPAMVALSGSYLFSGIDYTVSGTTLTLSSGALAGQILCCFYGPNLVTQSYVGLAGQSTLTCATFAIAAVVVDGSVLSPDVDYTLAENVITLASDLLTGQNVAIVYQTGAGSAFIFGPFPDSGYTVQGTYYQSAPLLSSTQPTNWMVLKAPNLMLAACMRELGKFLKDAAMIQMWEEIYTKRLQGVLDRDKAERWAGSTLQVEVG